MKNNYVESEQDNNEDEEVDVSRGKKEELMDDKKTPRKEWRKTN